MNARQEHEREVLRILEDVLQLPPGERDAALLSATDDEAVLAAVRELVALEQAGEEISLTPSVPTQVFRALGLTAPQFARGTTVGAFTIEALLGEGGMGRVYTALQESPRRRVALKTLRRGLDSEQAIRRFRVEGELLAQLGHPGIAQVFGSGIHRVETEGGLLDVPYMAMELLEHAKPVVLYAEEVGLGREERLQLFLSVCEAVQHAHQRGIIHRDLKPGNILVDQDGRVRVIDFGIARATGLELGMNAVETQAGEFLGTLSYMSPEQLTLEPGELDTRVDVYALGSVLYELTCGRPVLEAGKAPLAKVTERILTRGPVRPRQLVPSFPADLEAVVLKALAREREERYVSVAALADDLKRFSNHEPVVAQPPTLWYQARLFARRNRRVVAAAVVVVLSLLSATAIGVTSAVAARRAEGEQRAARVETDAYLRTAFEANLDLVFEFAMGIAELRGGTELRLGLLRSAFAKLEELEGKAPNVPDLLPKLAAAYMVLGDALGSPTSSNVGDPAGARRAYERAGAILEGATEDMPGTLRARVILETRRADLALVAGDRLDEVMAHREAALVFAQQVLEEHPEDEVVASQHVQLLGDLGRAYGTSGDHARAREHFFEVVEAQRARLARAPRDVGARAALANGLAMLGASTSKLGEYDDALVVLREALAMFEELNLEEQGDGRHAIGCAWIRWCLTDTLIEAGLVEEAIEEASYGAELAGELVERDPADVHVRRIQGFLSFNTAWAYERRAELAREDGRKGDVVRDDMIKAREWFLESRAVFQPLLSQGHLNPAESDYVDKIDERLQRIAETAEQ